MIVYAQFGSGTTGPFLTKKVPHKEKNGKLYIQVNDRWRVVINGSFSCDGESVPVTITA